MLYGFCTCYPPLFNRLSTCYPPIFRVFGDNLGITYKNIPIMESLKSVNYRFFSIAVIAWIGSVTDSSSLLIACWILLTA